MSKLMNVVYLLLVATATSAWELLPAAQKWFNDAVDSSILRTKSDYEAAKIHVETLVSQIQLESLQQSKPSSNEEYKEYIQIGYPFQLMSRQYEYPSPSKPPSAECREFLRKRTVTSRTQIIECLQSSLKSVKDQHDRLNTTMEGALAKLAAQRDEAKECVSSSTGNFYSKALAAMCYVNRKGELSTTVEGAKSEFSAAIENAKKVVNTWIPDAGHCVALAENPKSMVEWFQACKSSTESNDARLPTRPEIAHL